MDLRPPKTIIPAVPCVPGCADCCCPVPFSKREWAAVPSELKKGLDIRLTINITGRMMILPCLPGFLPAGIPQLIPAGQLGHVMRRLSNHETPASCPFCDNHHCCMIYEVRPLLCRIFGAVISNPPSHHNYLLTCKRNCSAKDPLSNEETDQLYLAWFENKRTWQEQ